MPELPEVETITNRLAPLLTGRKITAVTILHPKSFIGDQTDILNAEIVNVSRRAKMIRIEFSNGKNVLTHLKMTGQLIYVSPDQRVGGGHPTPDWINQLPSKHTRIHYQLDDTLNLYFNDQRLFGWMKIMTNDQVQQEFKKYGPDVTDDAFTQEYFVDKVSKKNVPIKVAIMDNSIMSGVGNIYACDSLNLAQISPFKKASELSEAELKRVYKSIRQIIHKAIFLGGATTDGKYVNLDGLAGKYQLEARVYDREGEACLHCGGKIVKEKLAGRGTYYCEQCQGK